MRKASVNSEAITFQTSRKYKKALINFNINHPGTTMRSVMNGLLEEFVKGNIELNLTNKKKRGKARTI